MNPLELLAVHSQYAGTFAYQVEKIGFIAALFLVVVLLMHKKAKVIFCEEYGARFLVRSAIAIFAITLAATLYYPAPASVGHYIGIVKNLFNLGVSLGAIVCSFYMCRKYWKKMKEDVEEKREYENSIYPTLMVTQGTFYTFVGVAAILFAYDGSSQNVSVVLSGLKLAFITSIIGMAYSVAAKNYLKQQTEAVIKSDKVAKSKMPTVLSDSDFYKVNSEATDYLAKIYDLQKGQEDRINSQVDKLNQLLENHIKESNGELTKNFENISNAMIQSVEDTFSKIQSENHEINASLKNTNGLLQDINTSLEQVKTKSMDLQAVFSSLESAYSSIKNQLSQSADDFAEVQKSFEALQTSITSFADKLGEHNPADTIKGIQELFHDLYETANAQLQDNKASAEESVKASYTMIEQASQEAAKHMETYSNLIKAQTDAMIAAMEKQRVAMKEYESQLSMVADDATKQDQIIKNGHESIVREYELLINDLIRQNDDYNKMMLEAQKNYHRDVTNVVDAVTDVISKAKDKYISDIDSLNQKIDSMSASEGESK
ncbi:hypothetical protein [Megasphaera sp.]|uniref:hypothetical protein n=1 Tax=Megasphaera sp. TaxID=2023260 RepID=UPI003AACC4E4